MSNENLRNINRRHFFRHFFGQSAVLADEARGKRQLRLCDLGKLSDEDLSKIFPRLIADAVITATADGGRCGHDSSERPISLQPEEVEIVALLDGRKSIGQIAAVVATLKQFSDETAFAAVRNLFIRLVDSGLCFPTNAVGADER